MTLESKATREAREAEARRAALEEARLARVESQGRYKTAMAHKAHCARRVKRASGSSFPAVQRPQDP